MFVFENWIKLSGRRYVAYYGNCKYIDKNDVFLNRKLCVALCGDLLSRYDQEKKIFQMLFQVGFGEVED